MVIKYLLFFVAVILASKAEIRDGNFIVDMLTNKYYPPKPSNAAYNLQNLLKGWNPFKPDRVKIQLYYECLCPDCRVFDTTQLKQTVLALGPYLDVYLYPFGNAEMHNRNGRVEFVCQHGPAECYGNKLHACAIDYLRNMTAAVLFNSCMMDGSQAGGGSDDRAADVCAFSMGIDSTPIKLCARGPRGDLLLQYFGIESKKANFHAVPYILVNGVETDGNNFMRDVCSAFRNPPPACVMC